MPKDYRLQSFLSIQYVNGDLCKHLEIDSSTDHSDRFSDRYSNLLLNAYIHMLPKCLHKSPCACQIPKNDLIL